MPNEGADLQWRRPLLRRPSRRDEEAKLRLRPGERGLILAGLVENVGTRTQSVLRRPVASERSLSFASTHSSRSFVSARSAGQRGSRAEYARTTASAQPQQLYNASAIDARTALRRRRLVAPFLLDLSTTAPALNRPRARTERTSSAAMVFATSPSSFSSLRLPILRLAKLGTAYPIEVIVTLFCAATLVYFQLIKVSNAVAREPISRRGGRARETRSRGRCVRAGGFFARSRYGAGWAG